MTGSRHFLAFAAVAFFGVGVFAAAAPTEIRIDLKLDASDFIVGERIRGVIDVANSSPDTIGIGGKFSVSDGKGTNGNVKATYDVNDRLFVEVYRASDRRQLTKVSKTNFVANFAVRTGEGQKLETFLGDHYALRESRRYLAKPVLVHDGVRFEGQPRAFDVVEGSAIGSALQMFSKRQGLQRRFRLVCSSKNRSEHLYLRAYDEGLGMRVWETRDLGPLLRIDQNPVISILSTGEVIVLHRVNRDQFIRSEYWSLPDELVFRSSEIVNDPTTAGTARVRELYKDKGVAPKSNPWWKFW